MAEKRKLGQSGAGGKGQITFKYFFQMEEILGQRPMVTSMASVINSMVRSSLKRHPFYRRNRSPNLLLQATGDKPDDNSSRSDILLAFPPHPMSNIGGIWKLPFLGWQDSLTDVDHLLPHVFPLRLRKSVQPSVHFKGRGGRSPPARVCCCCGDGWARSPAALSASLAHAQQTIAWVLFPDDRQGPPAPRTEATPAGLTALGWSKNPSCGEPRRPPCPARGLGTANPPQRGAAASPWPSGACPPGACTPPAFLLQSAGEASKPPPDLGAPLSFIETVNS
ncbi:hypothetical protein FQA47_006276 [Oryzias melastigma]|uniref:Uncharacterized protein n=1 Tax=Oryzias melastigma TaxID=30732 RepID=A0A834L1W0_ORYME|nr:hypothetical protein FQA47_006276 [Oryzias melastigma]